jgi:thiol-disulfide isomerase/thioredoxin
MLRFLFLFLFFGNVPLWGGVIVEYAVLTGDDVPDMVLPLLPQRVYAYIHDGHVAVRGEYLGSRLADYDLYPAGDAFRYECIGKNEATQHPLPVAEVLYTDDPPLTIARLPCRRALIVSELGDTSSVYFTDAFGINFCPIADIQGFALFYTKKVLGVEVGFQAINFKPAEFQTGIFDLSKRSITYYKPPKDDVYTSRSWSFIGKAAPPISDKTLTGTKIDTAYLRGKVVSLNFWFTTCPPCKQELPALNVLAARYTERDDVIFIAVALDNDWQLNKFLEVNPFLYQIIPNGRSTASRYGVESYPTNMVIDRQGNIIEHVIGYRPDIEKRLETAILKALKKQ